MMSPKWCQALHADGDYVRNSDKLPPAKFDLKTELWLRAHHKHVALHNTHSAALLVSFMVQFRCGRFTAPPRPQTVSIMV